MKKVIAIIGTFVLIGVLSYVWYATSDFATSADDSFEAENNEIEFVIHVNDGEPDVSHSETLIQPSYVPIPEDAIEVSVVWVSDGDTYIVDLNGTETTIRLIGVDTPESVAPDDYLKKSGKQNSEDGKIASGVMKELLPEGTKIWICIGEESTDDYGRTLAYAWFSDGTMIEDFLLANGYAVTLTIEPNTAYAEHFKEIENAYIQAKGAEDGT